MANIFDYLNWRGDLSFDADPFNEVDSLILCKLCSADLTGIVAEGDGEAVPLWKASEEYFRLHGEGTGKLGLLASPNILPMFKIIGSYPRFADLPLTNYAEKTDRELEEQFSALTIGLPDGSHYVAFRGTDDNIVAWKENFNMSSADSVPAQRDAQAYLERAAWLTDGPLRVGGHSKGGNLAVYSAMHADKEVQERIEGVYNFDGPGFLQDVMDRPEYRAIEERIATLVPQYSMVGMLLCHDEEYEIVRSDETGISAHDGFTWEVLGRSFVRCEDFAYRARVFDSAVHKWLSDIDLAGRQEFVDTLFSLLTSTGATTLSELSEHKIRQAIELIGTLRQEPEQREVLTETLEVLIKECVSSGIRAIPLPELPRMKLPSLRRRKKDSPGAPDGGPEGDKSEIDGQS